MGRMKEVWQAEKEAKASEGTNPEMHSMLDLCKMALASGFKYESLRVLDPLDQGTDEFLLRIYSDDGEITTRVTTHQMHELGMEVLET